MVVKTVIFAALLLFPSLLYSQNIKPAFSIHLKTDKLNYEFGEDICVTLTLKNISTKADSISKREIENITSDNINLFRNGKLIQNENIPSSIIANTYLKLKPDEEFSEEFYLNHKRGQPLLGKFCNYIFLDTGYYKGSSCVGFIKNINGRQGAYECVQSNEIYFKINLTDISNSFLKLKNLLDFTLDNFRDTVFMYKRIREIGDFIYGSINSYFSDYAFYLMSIYTQIFGTYKGDFIKLSNFYLSQKPNGSQVSTALWCICSNTYIVNLRKQEKLEKLDSYIKYYPNTKIEIEAKKIIEYVKQENEEN